MEPNPNTAVETLAERLEVSAQSLEGWEEISLLERGRLLTTTVLRVQLMRLAMKGVPAVQAAKLVGCHVNSARAHYADPSFRQAVLSKVNKAFADIDSSFMTKKMTLHEKLDEQADRSFEDLVSLLNDVDLPVHHRIKINQDFLNRSKESQQQTQVNLQRVDPQQLMLAARAAREMDNVIPITKERAS